MKVDIEGIEQLFWPNGGNRNLWMIVDSARDRRIYSDLMNSHLIYSCLYSGNLPEQMEAAAPHLVQLEFEDKSTRDLIRRSWAQSWGVFLRCDARINHLRRHLRTLLTVRTWNGDQLLFRYYDPRVLRVYLPTCNSDELKTVFGPIQQFFAEAESGESLTSFGVAGGRLLQTQVDVTGSQRETPAL